MIFPGSCIASVLALDPLYLGLAGRAASGGALDPEPARATCSAPEPDCFHFFQDQIGSGMKIVREEFCFRDRMY